jgi:UDP-GlcNAc:undecaprenyl-phosphate GlcNAc-1-phosphate transferase
LTTARAPDGTLSPGDAQIKGAQAVTSLEATILIGLCAFVLAVALVPVVRSVAVGYGVTDQPNPQKLHQLPVPYLGGVAIALTALLVSAFMRGWKAEATVILLGAALVAAVGLVDDLRNLTMAPRLATEVVAALLAASTGARVHIFGNELDWVVTVVWLVVVTNSFNLLDNMDGAAGTVASTTAVGLAIAAGIQGQWLVGGLAAVVAGSCMGFLIHNWHPAKIFMGDAGSLFVGYLLAAIALKLRFPTNQISGVAAVVLFTLPALFDTTVVVIARFRSGRPILQGGTDHTAHRLLRRGLSTHRVAVLLGLTCCVTSALGIAVGQGALAPVSAVPPVLAIAAGGLYFFLGRPEPAEPEVEAAVSALAVRG